MNSAHLIEYSANIFYIVSTFFASRNSLHTWWTGIISCTLFAFSFYSAQLYADVTLNFFYIGTCIYGWIHWQNGGKNKEPLPITHINLKKFILYFMLAVIVAISYGTLLTKLTNASNPFWDSAILTLSIFGQLLIMNRIFENWYVWFIVDSLAIPLYYKKELYTTSLLYVGILALGVMGYFQWKKELSLKKNSVD